MERSLTEELLIVMNFNEFRIQEAIQEQIDLLQSHVQSGKIDYSFIRIHAQHAADLSMFAQENPDHHLVANRVNTNAAS